MEKPDPVIALCRCWHDLECLAEQSGEALDRREAALVAAGQTDGGDLSAGAEWSDWWTDYEGLCLAMDDAADAIRATPAHTAAGAAPTAVA